MSAEPIRTEGLRPQTSLTPAPIDHIREHESLAWLEAKCPAGGNCLAPYTGKAPTVCVKCGARR